MNDAVAWDYAFFGGLFLLMFVSGIMIGLEVGRKRAFRSVGRSYQLGIENAYQYGFDAGYNTGKVDLQKK